MIKYLIHVDQDKAQQEAERLHQWLIKAKEQGASAEQIENWMHTPETTGSESGLSAELRQQLQDKPLPVEYITQIAHTDDHALLGRMTHSFYIQHPIVEQISADVLHKKFEHHVIDAKSNTRFQKHNLNTLVSDRRKQNNILARALDRIYWSVEQVGPFDADKLYSDHSALRNSLTTNQTWLVPYSDFPFQQTDMDSPYYGFSWLVGGKKSGFGFLRFEVDTEKPIQSLSNDPQFRDRGHVYVPVVALDADYLKTLEAIDAKHNPLQRTPQEQTERKTDPLVQNMISGLRRIVTMSSHDYIHNMTVPNPTYSFGRNRRTFAALGSDHSSARGSLHDGQEHWAREKYKHTDPILGIEPDLTSLEFFSYRLNYDQWQKAFNTFSKEQKRYAVKEETIKGAIRFFDELKQVRERTITLKTEEFDGDQKKAEEYANKMTGYFSSMALRFLFLTVPMHDPSFIDQKYNGKSIKEAVIALDLPPVTLTAKRAISTLRKGYDKHMPAPTEETIGAFLQHQRDTLLYEHQPKAAFMAQFVDGQTEDGKTHFKPAEGYDGALMRMALGFAGKLPFLLNDEKALQLDSAKLVEMFFKQQQFDARKIDATQRAISNIREIEEERIARHDANVAKHEKTREWVRQIRDRDRKEASSSVHLTS